MWAVGVASTGVAIAAAAIAAAASGSVSASYWSFSSRLLAPLSPEVGSLLK